MATQKSDECAHYPAFAFRQRERDIAANCAKKQDPTKRKLPAIAAIRRAPSREQSTPV